jgi:hypothetical protein
MSPTPTLNIYLFEGPICCLKFFHAPLLRAYAYVYFQTRNYHQNYQPTFALATQEKTSQPFIVTW